MLQRRTQTPAYWEQSFAVTPDDIEHLYRYVLERAVPVAIEELILELVRHRCQQEEQLMRAELARGVIYQPKGSYAVGDQVVFPAFDYRLGVVRAIRQGHNPEHGDFNVIAVQLEGEDTTPRVRGRSQDAPSSQSDGQWRGSVEIGEPDPSRRAGRPSPRAHP